MKNLGKKLYITAFILSIASTCLLIAGMMFHGATGRDGLVPLIVFSVTAFVFALLGIILLCIDMKS